MGCVTGDKGENVSWKGVSLVGPGAMSVPEGAPAPCTSLATAPPQVLPRDLLRDKPPTSPMLFGKAGGDDCVRWAGTSVHPRLWAPSQGSAALNHRLFPQRKLVGLGGVGGSEGGLGAYLGIAKG